MLLCYLANVVLRPVTEQGAFLRGRLLVLIVYLVLAVSAVGAVECGLVALERSKEAHMLADVTTQGSSDRVIAESESGRN